MVVRFYLFGNYVSHNLGHSFSPVCLLLSGPSPNGKHSVDYSVYCIEIARCLARAPFGLVLQEIRYFRVSPDLFLWLKLRNLRRNTLKNKNIFYLCHAIGRWRTY